MDLQKKVDVNIEFLKHLSKWIKSNGIEGRVIDIKFHKTIWMLEKTEIEMSYEEILKKVESLGYIYVGEVQGYKDVIGVGFTRKGIEYKMASSKDL